MRKIQKILPRKRLLALLLLLLFLLLVEFLGISSIIARTDSVDHKDNFNFLILGVGGARHEVSDLTDSIMVLMTNQNNKKVFLLSLPRDIWIEAYKAKINSLYHYGGFDLVGGQIEEIVGRPTDRILVVDFRVFEELINFIGGVEIEVDRPFDDYYYPIPGREDDDCDGDRSLSCRYEHLHFEAGKQTMGGQQALKFVRSRNAEGEEGTDFARSKRQQKVMIALKDKISSPEILFSPLSWLGLWRIAKSSVRTDITPKDYLPLLKFFIPFGQGVNFESTVLNGGAFDSEGFLYHPAYHPSNQWVLLPVGGNWEGVREYIREKVN